MFKGLAIIIALATASNSASMIECRDIVKTSVDKNIKTSRGWKRVCSNDKIEFYLLSDKFHSDEVCECLLKKMNVKSVRKSRTLDMIFTEDPTGGEL